MNYNLLKDKTVDALSKPIIVIVILEGLLQWVEDSVQMLVNTLLLQQAKLETFNG